MVEAINSNDERYLEGTAENQEFARFNGESRWASLRPPQVATGDKGKIRRTLNIGENYEIEVGHFRDRY
mgnify:CR=1 FL=1